MSALPAPDPAPDHFVCQKPFNPHAAETLSPEQERVYLASQWQLMWWKFRRHKLAVVSAVVLAVFYVSILFCEFLAPYNPDTRHTDFIRAAPQGLHLFHDGKFVGPFVYQTRYTLDRDELKREYPIQHSKIEPLRFFCHGERYRFWDLFDGDLHLFCPTGATPVFLLGSDKMGHDMLSRLIYGARISLTIGLIGISISFTLGIIIGGLAGYYGGWFDLVVQRLIEIIQSLPHIPLWLALSAILPANWSPVLIYFGITIILGLIDWTGLARAVRSKLLSLREEDYVTAAQLMGAGTPRILARHLIPGFMSHLIASATITIPKMILAETALSFLGFGLHPPTVSWGVMMTEAQNINVVALYPWLMLPIVPVVIVILAFNFLGDGLRDAADPYH